MLGEYVIDDEENMPITLGSEDEQSGGNVPQSFLDQLICGKRRTGTDDIRHITLKRNKYYQQRNIWTCCGLFMKSKRNLANCFGFLPLQRGNLYDCFGLRSPYGKLGTFFGVIMPVILKSFGVLVFTRLPMIVGNGGILLSIFLITLCYFVSILSALSASAIATGGKSGSHYYMISRILGPTLGGSIGIIIFFTKTLGASLQLLGFAGLLGQFLPSSVTEFLGGTYATTIIFGTIVLFLMLIVLCIGFRLIILFMFIVFVVLMGCLLAIFLSFGGILYSPGLSHRLDLAKEDGYVGWNRHNFKTNLLPYHDYLVDSKNTTCNTTEILNDYGTHHECTENCSITFNCVSKYYVEETHWDEFGTDPQTGKIVDVGVLLSYIFPLCTGILVGTGLSSSLKNPSRSIPRGTCWGMIISYILLVSLIVFIGSTTVQEHLVTNSNIMMEISFSPNFFEIGVFCIVLISALNALFMSSRTLFALSNDNIFPLIGLCSMKFLNEPRYAIFFTCVLVQCFIFIGKLDVVALFLTIFFIFKISILNFACLILSILEPPNFRPTVWLYSWWSCLFGLICSIVLMFYIDWRWSLFCGGVCGVAMIVIFFHTKYKPKPKWGSIIDAILHYVGTFSLHGMMKRKSKDHLKYWKFKSLLFVSDPRSQLNLIKFLNELSAHRGGVGILANIFLMKSRCNNCENNSNAIFREKYKYLRRKKESFQNLIHELKLKMFPAVIASSSVREGIQCTIVTSGIGGIVPNCIVLDWFGKETRNEMNNNVNTSYYEDEEEGTLQDSIRRKFSSLMGFEPYLETIRQEKNALDRFDEDVQVQEEELRESSSTSSSRLLRRSEEKRIQESTFSLDDYMETIKDILSMQKSLLITRNFHLLDESLVERRSGFSNINSCKKCMMKKNRKQFVDLWIFSNGVTDDFIGPSVSLILQLGYLFKTGKIHKWNRDLKVRVLAIHTSMFLHSSKKEYKESIQFFVNKLGNFDCEICVVEVIREDYQFMFSREDFRKTFEMSRSRGGGLSRGSNSNNNTSFSSEKYNTFELDDVEEMINDVKKKRAGSINIEEIELEEGGGEESILSTSSDDDMDEYSSENNGEEIMKIIIDEEEIKKVKVNNVMLFPEDDEEEEIQIIIEEKSKKEKKRLKDNSMKKKKKRIRLNHHYIGPKKEKKEPPKKKEEEQEEEKANFYFGNQGYVSFGDLTVEVGGKIPVISIPGLPDYQLQAPEMVRVLKNVILRNSENSSIILLPFPPPPSIFEQVHHKEYYRYLDILTDTNIPTVLVHSDKKVLYFYI